MNENHLSGKKPIQEKKSAQIEGYSETHLSCSIWIWGAPILWMLWMRFLSSDTMNGESTSRFIGPILHWTFPEWNEWQLNLGHYMVRKTAHIIEYSILTGLWIRAFSQKFKLTLRVKRFWMGWKLLGIKASLIFVAICISVIYAIIDEFLQTLTESRTGNPGDVLFDSSGAIGMGVLLFLLQILKKNRRI